MRYGEDLNFLSNVEIHCQAAAGCHISPCSKQAVIMALLENRKVYMTHNATTYIVDPDRAIGAMIRVDHHGV